MVMENNLLKQERLAKGLLKHLSKQQYQPNNRMTIPAKMVKINISLMIQGKMVVRVQICLFDESSEDGDEEQPSQEGTPVKVPINTTISTKQTTKNK